MVTNAEAKKLEGFLDVLDMPFGHLTSVNTGEIVFVDAVDLYKILTDEEKLVELICKLKNKAFW
jgi:hypothetical protein